MSGRRLLGIPTSKNQKSVVTAMVERLLPWCEVWLFVWDGSPFEEKAFSSCRVVHRDRFNKWDFAREFLRPDLVAAYDVLFMWDDDLDLTAFDPELFLAVMDANQLEMAQPALTRNSYFSHQITLQQPGVGRLTDFVEVMAPAWTREAWSRWYRMLTPENPWGWGYDLAARSACGYQRMGIVDCTPVRHLKPLTRLRQQFVDMKKFFAANPQYRPCKGENLGRLVTPASYSAELSDSTATTTRQILQ